MVKLVWMAASCGSPCGVADSVSVVDNRNGLYLVYRISGAQEKVEIFELYGEKPVFDACGKSNTGVLAQAPYIRAEGFLKALESNGNQLEVRYTSERSEALDPAHVQLEGQ